MAGAADGAGVGATDGAADGGAIDGAVEAGADADGAVDADGGADGGSDAAASWTVKANWPRSMSPSSADAEVHLIVYVPSREGRRLEGHPLGRRRVARPDRRPVWPEQPERALRGVEVLREGEPDRCRRRVEDIAVGGIRRDELGVGEGGRGAGEGQEQGRERRVDRPAGDGPGGWATRKARLGDASDTHGCGV